MAEITWLGHACWLIETKDVSILVDPYLNDSPVAPVKAESLQPNFILVTHGHFDHIADAGKIAQRTGATVVSNFEICEWLSKQGAASNQPMNLGGAITLPFGRVKMTMAQHSSALPDGSNGGNPAGFIIEIAGQKIYIAGDTALFSDMRLIGAVGIDLAVLPIGDRFTMGPDDSIEAIKLLAPKKVAPSHYNTWPPIAQNAAAWAKRVKEETKAEPIVVGPGGKFSI